MITTFYKIFLLCNDILSHKYHIMGYDLSLYDFMFFSLFTIVILSSILRLFDKD